MVRPRIRKEREERFKIPKIPFIVKEIQKIHIIPEEMDKKLDEPVEISRLRLFSRKKIIFACFVAIALILIFRSVVVQALLIALLFAACSFSTVWKRKYPELPLGVELVIFGTAVASLTYGPVFGAFFGIAAAIATEVSSGSIGEGIFFSMVALSLVSVAANFFSGIDFVVLGIVLTLINDAICQALSIATGDVEARAKAAIFVTTHLLFNFLVFKLTAPVLSLFL